jgi:signal transduction histidine kinase/DNA-binding response OmpR family regulator
MGYSDHGELKTGVHFKEVIEHAADSGNFPDAAASAHAWVAKHLELHHSYIKAHVEKYRDDRWQQLGTHRTGVGGTVAVFSDVTEIKQISEELKHSMQVAEAANEAKSAFLATMSHEIRTPLNGIIGMSNLLQGTQLDVEQRDYSSTISVAADTLLTIINDILDFSKVEAGALELERVPIDLVETVESTVELLASKAAEKGIELACQIDSDVPQSVLGDSTRIKQVLMNLLNNAIKFTDVGEVVLTIANNTPGNQFASGSNVLLNCSIRDTGIGIPENRMDRLFKSFSQVDASTTRRFGGTGLGLVITKRLVELMGGEISVESQVGVGTTFVFTVPFVVAELPDRKSRHDQIESLRGSRVLIVDDNRTNRLILSEKLRSWEMDPKATESPVEALELLEQNASFDTCIIDYKMPEMNGLELARRVRQIKGTSTPPMILFSSISMVEDSFRKGVEEMDFAAVLTKPSRSGQLLDALSKAIVPAADSPVENGRAVAPADTTVPETLASLRILLVDDNFINRKVGKKILTKLGYQPEIVSSGFEAIEQCQANDFDVVLMDIEMPDLDGISASNEIRKRIPVNRMPYIIALTANAMSNERESYLQSGMDGYLSKPIDIPALVGSLHDARNYRDQL